MATALYSILKALQMPNTRICHNPQMAAITPTRPFTHPTHPPPQMATALYFIDKLALRAGHEKDEDEADTVGCCTLKVGGALG